MPKLPPCRPEDVVHVARGIGFVLDRQKGSHAVYLREIDRRRIVVPMHRGDLKTGTLRGLVSDMGLTVDRFVEILSGKS
ncbi:MAG TPA: type II toxin-antitoxin system HicA family toxin [Polyangia bacterium]|nr:type II toxin-antitoxin system HicA family toxin [Polyangia bacterium]